MTKQELKNEIKELKERLEKLETVKIEEPQLKRWKPKYGETYWLSYGNGHIGSIQWGGDCDDDWFYLIGNCFKTKEEAEKYKKQIEYTARYKNYIEEHSEPLDWNNRFQEKYYAYISLSDGIDIDYAYNWKTQGTVYASSKQIIEDAINEIGEDNFKKYVLGVK